MMSRKFFNSASFALILGASLCGWLLALSSETVHAAGRFEGQTLKVGTWGGRWGDFQRDIIAPKIEAEGGKVVYVFGSTQDNLAKIAAARGREAPVDVLEILDAMLPIFEREDLLATIDLSQVPNRQHLQPGFYDERKVATWIVQEGICYNRDKFEELGVPAPRTYKDLGHPKLEG